MQSDRNKLFNEGELEKKGEEDELMLRRTKKSTTQWLANIPILGYLISTTITLCSRRYADVMRRRRSYKLSLYFQLQMIFAFSAFIAFFVVALQDISLLGDPSRVNADCVLPSTVVTPEQHTISLFTPSGELSVEGIYNYTTEARETLSCSNDQFKHLDAACELSEFETLVMLMLATGIFFIIAMIMSCLVFSGYNFFSNIPMEALDVGATSCKVSFLSSMCRFGPWLVRGMTLVNMSLILSLVLLTALGNVCFGIIDKTHTCGRMYDDCVKLQFENCRYYYSDNCVGPGLPHDAAQAANFKQCKDTDFAAKFSGRFDARLVYPTVCSRCWALDFDCKDPHINRMRFTNNVTAEEFVFVNTSSVSPAITQFDTLGRAIQCRCVEGIDLGLETFDSVKLTNNHTDCTHFVNTTHVCPTTLETGIGAAPVDVNATYWSFEWTDAVVNATPSQECSWAPDTPAFYYDLNECEHQGSSLIRFVFILGYTTLLLVAIFIVAGLAVRYSVQSETWSYSPHPPNEAWYWKALRLLGPG